jgi:chemotaxis response regulator CheB
MDTRVTAQLPFPIVGIGASAGGFPALATLLQNLPASPGVALVIVLHLPVDQQSNADRVLQGSTRLPVVQVDHSMPILPEHVYVIPPPAVSRWRTAIWCCTTWRARRAISQPSTSSSARWPWRTRKKPSA